MADDVEWLLLGAESSDLLEVRSLVEHRLGLRLQPGTDGEWGDDWRLDMGSGSGVRVQRNWSHDEAIEEERFELLVVAELTSEEDATRLLRMLDQVPLTVIRRCDPYGWG